MKTRKQYMAGEVTHQAYYGQFVDDSIRAAVEKRFGIKSLMQSASDEHLNSIPLDSWDQLGQRGQLCADKLRAAGDGPSLASAVCILKAAARQIIEAHKEKA